MAGIKDLTKVISLGSSTLDNVNYSGEERDKILNERHANDMASSSWLSQNIRPMTLLFLLICQGALIVAMFLGVELDVGLTSQVGALLFGAFAFYFNSKKGERIAEHNAKANIEITKMEMKTQENKDRAARRLERIKARNSEN
jgi:hypothetical protein